jgi:hypothetical protein
LQVAISSVLVAERLNVFSSQRPVLDGAGLERLRAILHRSPRAFGQTKRTWTRARLAQVAHERRG